MNPGAPTVADVLGSGDHSRAAQVVEQGLARVNAARTALASVNLPGPAIFRVVDERVAEVLQDQFAIDLGGLVLEGWPKYRELVAAAQRTRDSPGPPEDVILDEHELAWTYCPQVDVIVNGHLCATMTFEVAVSLTIRGVIAIVEKGRLVALRCGEVVAGASISLDGKPLAHGECPPFVAGVLVKLGDGVALVSGAPAPGPAPRPVPTSAANAQWWQRVPPQQPPSQPYQWPRPASGSGKAGGTASRG